jgi:periplasmic protein TonB
MPLDLFGDVAVRRAPRSLLRRVLTICSIALHAIVISAIVFVQLFAVGPLPLPHRPLIFAELRAVRLVDIPPPSSPRKAPSDPRAAVMSPGAPLDMPHEIRNAMPRETGCGSGPTGCILTGLDGIERGSVAFDPRGIVDGSATPPPPPPPPVPQKPVRLHAGMQAPVKVVHVDPIYPAIAQQARVQGVVILEAIIDERGVVKSVSVLRSIPLLDPAALDAVRRWRFTPARLNGEAVPVVMTVTVRFTLDR